MKSQILYLLLVFSNLALAGSPAVDQSLRKAVDSLADVMGATGDQAVAIENAASNIRGSEQFKRVEASQVKKVGRMGHQVLICAVVDGGLIFINGEIGICSDLTGRLYKITSEGYGPATSFGSHGVLPGVAAKIFVIYAVSNTQPLELVRSYNSIKATAAYGWIGGQVGVHLSRNQNGSDRRPGTLLISLGYSAGFNLFLGFSGLTIEMF